LDDARVTRAIVFAEERAKRKSGIASSGNGSLRVPLIIRVLAANVVTDNRLVVTRKNASVVQERLITELIGPMSSQPITRAPEQ